MNVQISRTSQNILTTSGGFSWFLPWPWCNAENRPHPPHLIGDLVRWWAGDGLRRRLVGLQGACLDQRGLAMQRLQPKNAWNKWIMHVYIYIYVCIYIYIFTCRERETVMNVYLYLHLYICVCGNAYICIYIYTCMYIYIYIHTCVCIYVFVYSFTYLLSINL